MITVVRICISSLCSSPWTFSECFMPLQQHYINGILVGVFDVGVNRAIPDEETSAVGSPPASTPLISRKEPCSHALYGKREKTLMFCKLKARRQLHEYQLGQSAFVKGLVSSCFSPHFRTNVKYTWKCYHSYQTLALGKLTKPKELIDCVLTI